MSEGSMLMPYPESHWCSQQPPVALQYLQFGIDGVQASKHHKHTRVINSQPEPQLLLKRSRSYGVVWNDCAACWRWLIKTCKFVWFHLIYSLDGTNVYGSRGGEREGIRSVYGVYRNSCCKIVLLVGTFHSLVQTLVHTLFVYATRIARNNS